MQDTNKRCISGNDVYQDGYQTQTMSLFPPSVIQLGYFHHAIAAIDYVPTLGVLLSCVKLSPLKLLKYVVVEYYCDCIKPILLEFYNKIGAAIHFFDRVCVILMKVIYGQNMNFKSFTKKSRISISTNSSN